MVNQKYDLVNHSCTNTIKLVSRRIKKFIELNDKIPNSNSTLTHFHSKHVAPISIESYLNRILKYTLCGNECFLSVLVYFHRMSQIQNYIPSFPSSCKKNKKPFIINSYNIHRLLIAGITVSAKFNSDIFFLNSHYAKVGGLPINELNSLEMEFLMLNNYDLHVSVEELQYTGDCLLNNTLPEPVIINGVKRMELLAQPVFFNKNINKFALTFEDTIMIEKKIRDEEKKYGRAARLIQKRLYEKPSNDSINEKDGYHPLKYSKSYDVIRSSSKKKQLEEAYRYHTSHHIKPPMSSNGQLSLPYQLPNSLPYVGGGNSSGKNNPNDYVRNHLIKKGNGLNNSISSKSSRGTNNHLNYRHSTTSLHLSGYQEKLELQNKMRNSTHHESMTFIPSLNDKEENSSTKSLKMALANYKNNTMKYGGGNSIPEVDEKVLRAKFKSYIDPNNQLSSKDMEKYQKSYNTFREMYIKEVLYKSRTQPQTVPVDSSNKTNLTSADALTSNSSNANPSNSSISTNKRPTYKIKGFNPGSRSNSMTNISSLQKDSRSENSLNISGSSNMDDDMNKSYRRKNEIINAISPDQAQRLQNHRQGLNPLQSNNHRVSHLDLNQASRIKNRASLDMFNGNIKKNNNDHDNNGYSDNNNNNDNNRTSQCYTDDSFELSSPKPTNDYKKIHYHENSIKSSGNSKKLINSSKSKTPSYLMNGEYEMKTYYKENHPQEDSILSADESYSYNHSTDVSFESDVLSETSYSKNSDNNKTGIEGSSIVITELTSMEDDHHSFHGKTHRSGNDKGKKSVHKRISRNFNRILNNFNGSMNSESTKITKEKEKEKEKENQKNKSKENIQKARKGIKLVERKIKGLSFSNLLKQNKSDDEDIDDFSSKPTLKERHSFSVLSLTHIERQKLNMFSHNVSDHTNKDQSKETKEIKENEEESSKNLKVRLKPETNKSKSKRHHQKKSKSHSSLKSKKSKDEKSLESSRKYYETLTNILKRNKENSKKNKTDYSHLLNDIDIKVTSNSNDTINQITEIYENYTDSNQPKNEKETIPKESSKGDRNNTTVVQQKQNEELSEINGMPIVSEGGKTISAIEKKVYENEKVENSVGQDCVFNEKSIQLGEFDTINDSMGSFYSNDLNDEKKIFNQNIYDFNKYYQNKYDTNEENSLEEGDVEISSSSNILNNFDIKSEDEREHKEKIKEHQNKDKNLKKKNNNNDNNVTNNDHHQNHNSDNSDNNNNNNNNDNNRINDNNSFNNDNNNKNNNKRNEKFENSVNAKIDIEEKNIKMSNEPKDNKHDDLIKKSHSYSATDIYSYYSNIKPFQNNVDPGTSSKNEVNNLDQKKNPQNLYQELINNGYFKLDTNLPYMNVNDHNDNYKDEIERIQNKSNCNCNPSSQNYCHDQPDGIIHVDDKESSVPKEEQNISFVNSPNKMRKYSIRNTEDYENEIHNIKNFLEQQNETINADISKFSTDEGEFTNISSFATSFHSTYISSSIRDDKNLSLISEKSSVLENERIQPVFDEVEVLGEEIIISDNDHIQKENIQSQAIQSNQSSQSSHKVNRIVEYEKNFIIKDEKNKEDIEEKVIEYPITEDVTEVVSETKFEDHLNKYSEDSLDTEDKIENIENNISIIETIKRNNNMNPLNSNSNLSPYPHPNDFGDNTDNHPLIDENNSKNTISHQSNIINDSIVEEPNNYNNDNITDIKNNEITENECSIQNIYPSSSNDIKDISKSNSNENTSHHIERKLDKHSIDSSNFTYSDFVKRSGAHTINYTSLDFNNPLSYISYPNCPIQNGSDNKNDDHYHESFQNLLKQFQKNGEIDKESSLNDLLKKYEPSHHQGSSLLKHDVNNEESNITFNDILEKFKKNCNEIDDDNKIRFNNNSTTTNISTIPATTLSSNSVSSATNDIHIISEPTTKITNTTQLTATN